MSNSNTRHVLILLVIFMALLVLSLLQFRRGPSEAALTRAGIRLVEETPTNQRLFTWGIDAIQGMRLQRPVTDMSLTIQRGQTDLWVTTQGVPLSNQEVVTAAAAAIVSLEVRQTIPNVDPTRYSEFGLVADELNLLIQIVLRDGQTHTLAIGGLSPNRDSYYAIQDDSDDILILKRDEGAIDFLIKSLDNTN